jgi:asparagine synthase (glutamine-hydrolysing)
VLVDNGDAHGIPVLDNGTLPTAIRLDRAAGWPLDGRWMAAGWPLVASRSIEGTSVCGIAGLLGTSAGDPEVLRAMAACLKHRGPDAEGFWTDASAGVGLAHRRLSVLGLGEAGSQPMVSPSGRYVLVYNGETYDHPEMRAALNASGRTPAWRGGSDTETLLAGFEAWGVRATLERATGMWALAVWDREQGVLTLARDRMGEKPLSYVAVGGGVAFASQPSAFERLPGFTPRIDPDALADLLRFGQIPRDRGIHIGVRKLPPGTLLELRPGEPIPEPEPYWSFLAVARAGLSDPVDASEAEQVAMVGEALERSVRGQLLADVPLGAFLSGGIDSSLVVATMRRVATGPVRTFTIGFLEDGFDESPYARAVASHLGTDHTELILTSQDALDLIPDLPTIYDEPFADSSQLPTTLVSRLAREQVTVALSGDGGDELFGGYTRYGHAEWLAGLPWLVGRSAELAYGMLGQERRRSLARTLTEGDWSVVRRLLSANPAAERLVLDARPGIAEEAFRSDWGLTEGLGGLTARSMALDSMRYLPDDILHKVDRAAMSVSLETRVPLLDHRIVELAWRLPMHSKVRDGKGKWVLRELLARDVPRELFERPKTGFGIPVGAWLTGPLRPWAEDLLSPATLHSDGLLDVGAVRRIWDDHIRGRWDAGGELWPILMFQAWHHRSAGVHGGQH